MTQDLRIEKYMTSFPHTVGRDQPLEVAENMMREFGVRHLPVLDGGKLVGVITDRDIKMVESFKDVDHKRTIVEEAMTQEPYFVNPDSSMQKVCKEMADRKYGCALVVDKENKLKGIFSWVDGFRALSELLSS